MLLILNIKNCFQILLNIIAILGTKARSLLTGKNLSVKTHDINIHQSNLKMLTDISPMVLSIVQPFGDFKGLYFSSNAKKVLSYDAQLFYEGGFWWKRIHPEDVNVVSNSIAKAIKEGHSTHECRFLDSENKWKWIKYEVIKVVKDSNGNPIELIGVLTDVTQQKADQEMMAKREERFSLAFEATKDLLYDWNLSNNDIWFNSKLFELCGYPVSTALTFDWWIERIHPDDYHLIHSSVEETLNKKLDNWTGEYRFLLANGEYTTFLDKGFIVYDQTGIPQRWVGCMSDISLIRETENELRCAKLKADESAKLKSEFLANMSHEIRTPLNGIIGMTELTLETDLNTDQRRYLETVNRSSETLLSLINDILDFSKIDAGKLDITPVPFFFKR